MQQVKTRVQELTGARPSSSSKLYQGADSAVDKARAKLGIHNKSAELCKHDPTSRQDQGKRKNNGPACKMSTKNQLAGEKSQKH
jgi:hypothetical protein